MGIYEAVAYAMRYWFAFVILAMLFAVIVVSIAEYRDRKRILSSARRCVGFLEVLRTSDSGIQAGGRFAISPQSEVGAGAACDIVINGAGVLKKHARIVTDGRGCRIEVRAPNNTQLNGKAVRSAETLVSGDILLIGDTALRVQLKEGEGE